MLHAHPLFGRPVPPPPVTPSLLAPFTPASYLRLRRSAAKLSVDQVAERLTSKDRDQAEIRALVRLLETPGVVARHVATLDLLREAFPFDPDVYRQLAAEPAVRHPRICRGCGCSQWDPCEHAQHGPCAWAGTEICTRCTDGELL